MSEWADKVSATPDAPGGEFGPLVAYAYTDIPVAVQNALGDDFAPSLRVHFHRKLRDSDVLFRIFTVEILSEFREVISWWRNLDPDREAKLVEQVARTGEGVSLLNKNVVKLERKVDDLHVKMEAVLLALLRQVEDRPAQLSSLLHEVQTINKVTTDYGTASMTARDARDLLKSYPEPQRHWVGRLQERRSITTAWWSGARQVYADVGFGGRSPARCLVELLPEPLSR